jgi:hypothetical protein
MNRLLFALCWRLFYHRRWIPTTEPRVGRRCLCARHFVFQPKQPPETIGKNKAMKRLLWASKEAQRQPPKGYRI